MGGTSVLKVTAVLALCTCTVSLHHDLQAESGMRTRRETIDYKKVGTEVAEDLLRFMMEKGILFTATPLLKTARIVPTTGLVAMRFYNRETGVVQEDIFPKIRMAANIMALQKLGKLDTPFLWNLENNTLFEKQNHANRAPIVNSGSDLATVYNAARLEASNQQNGGAHNPALQAIEAYVTSQQSNLPTTMTTEQEMLLAASLTNIILSGQVIIAEKGILLSASKSITGLTMLLSLLGLVTDSIAIHSSIQEGDNAATAFNAVALTGSLVGLGMGSTSIILGFVGAATASTVVGVLALPVAAIAYGLSSFVGQVVSNRGRAEKAYDYLGHIVHNYENPLTWDEASKVLFPSFFTAFSHIDMKGNRLYLGDTFIRKNTPNLVFTEGYLDLVDGFGINKSPAYQFDATRPTMILPLTGKVKLYYEDTYTSTAMAAYPNWQIQRLKQLKEKTNEQFSFHSGFYAVCNIKAYIFSKEVKITLPSHPRTFLMAEGKYYAPTQGSESYDLDYEFIGGGSLAIIKVETRPTGTNRVILTSDASTKSIWLFTSKPGTTFSASMQLLQDNQCTFSVAGVEVRVERCSQQIVMVMNEGVVFMADLKQEIFVPFYLTQDWVRRKGGLSLATNLMRLKNVALSHYVAFGSLPIVASAGTVLTECVPNYLPSSRSIVCRVPKGIIFKSDDVFKFASDDLGKQFLMVKAYLVDLGVVPDGTNIFRLIPWFGRRHSG